MICIALLLLTTIMIRLKIYGSSASFRYDLRFKKVINNAENIQIPMRFREGMCSFNKEFRLSTRTVAHKWPFLNSSPTIIIGAVLFRYSWSFYQYSSKLDPYSNSWRSANYRLRLCFSKKGIQALSFICGQFYSLNFGLLLLIHLLFGLFLLYD